MNATNNNSQIFKIRKIIRQRKWTPEEDALLLKVVKSFKGRSWKDIAKNFKNKDSLQCFSRFKRIRPGLNRGPWTKEEDDEILKLIHIHGSNWAKISKIIGTRNGKQVRDRYINVLDPLTNKAKFSKAEDEKLIRLYFENGPKWATIAKFMDHRTPDMVKNRFHSSLKKQLGLDCINPSSVRKLFFLLIIFLDKKIRKNS